MEIYIVRHGDAREPGRVWSGDDNLRPLTDAGREEASLMGQLMLRLGVHPDALLTSPLVRARQTAEVLGDELGVPGKIRVCPDMAPGGSFDAIVQDINGVANARSVILIGHMSDVGQLAGYLAWAATDSVFPFRTAEVCRIDMPGPTVTPGSGDLRWLIPPRVARRLLAQR